MHCLCELAAFSIYDREIATRLYRVGKSRVHVKWSSKLHEEVKAVLCRSLKYIFCIALEYVRAIRQRSSDIFDKICNGKIVRKIFLLNLWKKNIYFILNQILLYQFNIAIIIFAYFDFRIAFTTYECNPAEF